MLLKRGTENGKMKNLGSKSTQNLHYTFSVLFLFFRRTVSSVGRAPVRSLVQTTARVTTRVFKKLVSQFRWSRHWAVTLSRWSCLLHPSFINQIEGDVKELTLLFGKSKGIFPGGVVYLSRMRGHRGFLLEVQYPAELWALWALNPI